jgi:membrane-associated guanylate kinase-related
VDQVLFDEEFDTEVQRKRTPSVSKMDRKDSAAPEEEEEEEQQRPALVNGVNGEGHIPLFTVLLF